MPRNNIPTQFRVNIKGLSSPLHFSFIQIKGELIYFEIFMSTKAKDPNRKNHEVKFLNQNYIRVDAENIGSTKFTLKEAEAVAKMKEHGDNKNKCTKSRCTHHPDGMPLF